MVFGTPLGEPQPKEGCRASAMLHDRVQPFGLHSQEKGLCITHVQENLKFLKPFSNYFLEIYVGDTDFGPPGTEAMWGPQCR